MQLDDVRSEIERMCAQIHRQRGEIYQLQRAGNVGSPLVPRVSGARFVRQSIGPSEPVPLILAL
jgi:hypothetical protein